MLKSTLTTWGDGVFESIRSIPRDWNEFHILWTTSVSVMVNLSSDRKQHSVSRVFSAATFPQWHESDGPWTHRPLRILDRAERDSPVTVTAVRCSLTGQSMAQQSFGAFEPIEFWDSSGVCEKEAQTARERETGGEREEHFSFPGEANESKQQQRLRRKTIWLFRVYRCRRFIFDSL